MVELACAFVKETPIALNRSKLGVKESLWPFLVYFSKYPTQLFKSSTAIMRMFGFFLLVPPSSSCAIVGWMTQKSRRSVVNKTTKRCRKSIIVAMETDI